uniref:TIL domain-containing protein n=1 Tax=Parastrongyloides trichosuri TaxID=131310 RepID=A0A0N4Z755_PARTI
MRNIQGDYTGECPENEIQMECGPCYPIHCYIINYFINPCMLNKCSPPGCYCKEGYGRKSPDDPTCILLSECKKK